MLRVSCARCCETRKQPTFRRMASSGQKDKAFNSLEKAYQERSSDLPWFLKADLRIDSLRSDPRYADLIRRVALPQ